MMEKNFREDFDSSVKVLLDGFHCLLSAYQDLAEKHYTLQRSLSATTQKLERLDPPSPAVSTEQQTVPSFDAAPSRKPYEWLEENANQDGASRDSVRSIKKAELISSKLQSLLHRSKITKSYRSDVMEQDFTIPGKEGKLGCPFSPAQRRNQTAQFSSSNPKHLTVSSPRLASHLAPSNGEPKYPSFNDPILVEKCGYETPALPPAAGNTACPIRFLDQHSPEEVAQYFEKHKHEIPRSHEVCVKRFQANAQSIRQLDAKYGNLVTMLQGLGLKHQPLLPEQTDEPVLDAAATKNVADWARSVSHPSHDNAAATTTTATNDPATHHTREISLSPPLRTADENPNGVTIENITSNTNHDSKPTLEHENERESHFDRPLKEIRVGESPSRPWGISIPPQYLDRDGSSDHSLPRAPPPAEVVRLTPLPGPLAQKQEQKQEQQQQPPPGRCPFHIQPAESLTTHTAPAPVPVPVPVPTTLAPAPAPAPAAGTQAAATAAEATATAKANAPAPAPAPAPEPVEPAGSRGVTITNHGVAVVQSASLAGTAAGAGAAAGVVAGAGGARTGGLHLVNYGTVFVDAPVREVMLALGALPGAGVGLGVRVEEQGV